MKKHESALFLSGGIWLIIGAGLLFKGIQFLTAFSKSGANEQWVLILVALGLFLGFIKGRFVLRKVAEKMAQRIFALPTPVSLKAVYTPRYFLLIACMMGLGMIMNVSGLRIDIRGVIDLAIGSALMHGGIAFFRLAFMMKGKSLEESK